MGGYLGEISHPMHRILLLIIFAAPWCFAQEFRAGDRVQLRASSALGVPLHPAPGNNGVSSRLPDGAVAAVREVDRITGWIRVEHPAGAGWIVRRYVASLLSPTPTAPPSPSPGFAPDADELRIGAWNLEYFAEDKKRGFPENTRGGPTYPPRTREDLAYIAEVIRRLNLRILVLSEVAGRRVSGRDGSTGIRSTMLDRLTEALGPEYAYEIAASGGAQRIALLWDRRAARLNRVCECAFDAPKVGGDALFARQPLIGHFTLLEAGAAMNDLSVVGVHLAAGQENAQNHDEAMRRLTDTLERGGDAVCVPSGERDIVIMGDFNANRFDRWQESFWDTMERGMWDVLADDAGYPATRLSGVPLRLRESRIDYIIITDQPGGLQGEEIAMTTAEVHTELIGDAPEEFRRKASDHLPVTVRLKIMCDTDSGEPRDR